MWVGEGCPHDLGVPSVHWKLLPLKRLDRY